MLLSPRKNGLTSLFKEVRPFFLVLTETNEQRHFYANKAKTAMASMRHFCLKRRLLGLLKSPRSGQHPDRDRNEIRICII